MTAGDWICCQLGAREHFAVPRALHRSGRLAALYTDAWIAEGSSARALAPRRLAERFHAELAHARVESETSSLLAFEALATLAGRQGWDRMIARNDWFQGRVADRLARERGNPGVFSFSYTANRLFELARSRGWRTALGQIDPGPAEERIVRRLHERHPGLAGPWQPAPPGYWEAWRRECELADRVVVNSGWTRDALASEGVPAEKLRVVPLAYDPPPEAAGHRREYPGRFTPERPLRVLFLGQLALRKGMAEILEAMRSLEGSPLEFRFVGPLHMALPASAREAKNARWPGQAARGEVARHYRECDAFLLPTHSDGFGLTQLEAQAWGLPILASRHCGEVVRDGVDGELLPEVSAEAIAHALRGWLADPARLARFSSEASRAPRQTVATLGPRLIEALEP